MAAGAVSLRKSHDIVILSFFNIVKGQANSVIFQGAFFQTTVSSLRLFSLTKMNVWGSRSATRKGLTVKYSDEPR